MPDSFAAVAAKLAENETAIAGLYELFARTYDVDGDLWTGLAAEERQHAEWIRQAAEMVTPEQRQQSLLSVRLPAIESMIQYVGSLADRCRRGELTRVRAMALAHDLEHTLLESRLLGTLSSGAARLAALEQTLVDSTARHRTRLAAALAQARQSG